MPNFLLILDNAKKCTIVKAVHLDIRKGEGKMAMTSYIAIAKEGLQDLSVLMMKIMMKDAASTENKFLSLSLNI